MAKFSNLFWDNLKILLKDIYFQDKDYKKFLNGYLYIVNVNMFT